MVRCLDCHKRRLTNKGKSVRVICWEDYQLCANCCIKKHPERYPLNIINQFLGIKTDQKILSRRSYLKKKQLTQT